MAQQMPRQFDRAQLLEAIHEECGPILRRIGRPVYRRPYPAYIDQVEIPQGYKVPNFTLFSGEGEQSTIEHIGRFVVQCGHIGNNENLRLKLFPNSLTGIAFSWYSNLPANSVHNWQEMEEAFHSQFYRTEPEVSMADLSRLHQLSHEPVEEYIRRFRKLKF